MRSAASTVGRAGVSGSRIWSTRALRSCAASAPGVAIVSVVTASTLVVSGVPSADDAVLSLDPMTASRAVVNRALWSSGRRPARLAWKITWWAMTARRPRVSPPAAARWASVVPARSKAATHSACPSSGPSGRHRLRASTVISVRIAGIRAADPLRERGVGGRSQCGGLRPDVALLEPVQVGGPHQGADQKDGGLPAAQPPWAGVVGEQVTAVLVEQAVGGVHGRQRRRRRWSPARRCRAPGPDGPVVDEAAEQGLGQAVTGRRRGSAAARAACS